MEFMLASSNAHKAQELCELAEGSGIVVKASVEKLTVIEDGISFQENAFKKAMAYFSKFQRPILADDSGLVVRYLPEELGVHSARFGGDGLSDEERARLLLKKLEGVEGQGERAAYFVCHLCFVFSEKEVYFFEGRMNGEIAWAYRGSDGFGYDPVFVPEGQDSKDGQIDKTLAELPEFKKQKSHRAIAMRYAKEFFKERHGQKG